MRSICKIKYLCVSFHCSSNGNRQFIIAFLEFFRFYKTPDWNHRLCLVRNLHADAVVQSEDTNILTGIQCNCNVLMKVPDSSYFNSLLRIDSIQSHRWPSHCLNIKDLDMVIGKSFTYSLYVTSDFILRYFMNFSSSRFQQ